jgi:hypothetical protein
VSEDNRAPDIDQRILIPFLARLTFRIGPVGGQGVRRGKKPCFPKDLFSNSSKSNPSELSPRCRDYDQENISDTSAVRKDIFWFGSILSFLKNSPTFRGIHTRETARGRPGPHRTRRITIHSLKSHSQSRDIYLPQLYYLPELGCVR